MRCSTARVRRGPRSASSPVWASAAATTPAGSAGHGAQDRRAHLRDRVAGPPRAARQLGKRLTTPADAVSDASRAESREASVGKGPCAALSALRHQGGGAEEG